MPKQQFSEDLQIDEYFNIGILREDVQTCFTESARNELMERNLDTYSTRKAERKDTEFRFLPWLVKFNDLLTLHNIKAAIIEPSILYCLLLPEYRRFLMKRSFYIYKFLGSKETVTYGIFAQDVSKLQEEETMEKFKEAGFGPSFVSLPVLQWMVKGTKSSETKYISHIFYTHKDGTFHLVVFQNRRSYLWHAALDAEQEKKNEPKNDVNKLLFVNHNGAYEKFHFVSLGTKNDSLTDFYIPSYSHYFLFQMLSSRFLECDSSRAANMTTERNGPKVYQNFLEKRFKSNTVLAIRQLKTVFHPLLMNLWIFAGTMLGWYRQCNIIPYTTDVDFGSWASEVEDLDHVVKLLQNSKHLTLNLKMGLLEEALEFQLVYNDLHIDVFFMYSVKNGSWCAVHNPPGGYYARCYYPNFTLCSGELLGEKIQVPCETEKVISFEYGPHWTIPVSSWNYFLSAENIGALIYWDEEKRRKAYETY